MRFPSHISFVTTMLMLGTAASAEPRYLESGIDNFNMNQLDAAMYEFEHAEKLHPENPMVHYYKASVLVRQNKTEEARDAYQRAMRLAPANSSIVKMCKLAIAALDQQLAKQGERKAIKEIKAETNGKHKTIGEEKKATSAKGRTQANVQPMDDPDTALLKATGGIPEPLIPELKKTGDDSSGQAGASARLPVKENQNASAHKSEPRAEKADETVASGLTAEEVEKACTEIRAHAAAKVAKMRASRVKGEDGDVPIYSEEDVQDVVDEAEAHCAKLRSTLNKKQITPSKVHRGAK